MIICEFGFFYQDRNKPAYYFKEIDFYAGLNAKDRLSLTLRKRIADDVFELFKWNHKGHDEVVFESKDLEAVLIRGNEFWDEYGSWGSMNKGLKWAGYSEEELLKKETREPDTVCEHKRPNIDSWSCPNIYRWKTEEWVKKMQAKRAARKVVRELGK